MAHWLARTNFKARAGMKFSVNGESYKLGGKTGDGAAGVVRKALKDGETRVVAVKFLAPDPKYISEDVFDDVAARFRREGQRGTKLDHESLVKVIAFEENKNGSAFEARGIRCPFIIMEYMQGSTLESYIRRQGKAHGTTHFAVTAEKLRIAIQISDALATIHWSRMVHRDVKPANIFLSERFFEHQEAKLGDFGIMKWGDFNASLGSGTLTATHHAGLGTMKYMAPEQAVRPRDVSAKADVYSLGITLYELFTNQVLESPHHVYEVMFQRMQRGTTMGRVSSLGLSMSMSDQDVAEMVLDMHSKSAAGRPTMDVVRGTLRAALSVRQETSE